MTEKQVTVPVKDDGASIDDVLIYEAVRSAVFEAYPNPNIGHVKAGVTSFLERRTRQAALECIGTLLRWAQDNPVD